MLQVCLLYVQNQAEKCNLRCLAMVMARKGDSDCSWLLFLITGTRNHILDVTYEIVIRSSI